MIFDEQHVGHQIAEYCYGYREECWYGRTGVILAVTPAHVTIHFYGRPGSVLRMNGVVALRLLKIAFIPGELSLEQRKEGIRLGVSYDTHRELFNMGEPAAPDTLLSKIRAQQKREDMQRAQGSQGKPVDQYDLSLLELHRQLRQKQEDADMRQKQETTNMKDTYYYKKDLGTFVKAYDTGTREYQFGVIIKVGIKQISMFDHALKEVVTLANNRHFVIEITEAEYKRDLERVAEKELEAQPKQVFKGTGSPRKEPVKPGSQGLMMRDIGPIRITSRHLGMGLEFATVDTRHDVQHIGPVLTLSMLQKANAVRNEQWDPDSKLDLVFFALEMAGEVGEMCNQIKKRKRHILGIRGNKQDISQINQNIKDELADVVICAALVANALDFNLSQAVMDKFNETSREQGFDITIGEET